MVLRFVGNTKSLNVNDVAPSNANDSIVVMLLGNLMLRNNEQSLNVLA